ncbi:hypothetical protein [Acutalibacter sp. 1XD8-33]|uniref:hypothetical protein n=1 Tax=Acutalibacter sp. 1XD8-33 TaxID=2320081 RepID=UPI001FA9A68A|nr:hypothetical protein [Acutalibacter sp. 1XD8-33]
MSKEQFILVSVLLEMFLEAGINTESIIQVSARESKIIIDTPDSTEDYVCDRDCDNCPLNAVPCEFELCKSWHECQLCCPCEANCDGGGLNE